MKKMLVLLILLIMPIMLFGWGKKKPLPPVNIMSYEFVKKEFDKKTIAYNLYINLSRPLSKEELTSGRPYGTFLYGIKYFIKTRDGQVFQSSTYYNSAPETLESHRTYNKDYSKILICMGSSYRYGHLKFKLHKSLNPENIKYMTIELFKRKQKNTDSEYILISSIKNK